MFIDDKLPNKEFLEDLKRFKKELVADGLGSLIPWLRSLADLETVKERRGAFNQFLKNPPDLSRRKFSKAVAAGFLGLTWLGRKANEEEAPKPTTKNIPRAIKQKAIPTTLSLAYNLHSILNNTPRVKLVRQPIFSRLDNAPIIIIIEDVHDMFNPKENWIGDASQIMAIKFILEMELGIRDWVVGLEGWVGEKVEKERGYKVNRNEKHPVWDLLAALKSKGNIPVIGIEDTYYHEQAIKFFAVKCDDGAIQWGYIEKIKSLPAGYADEQIRDEKERCRGILAEINLTFNQQTIDKARAEFDSLLSAHGLISKDKQEDFVSKELEKEKIRFFEEADEEKDG
ncbi:hypothetical protein HYU14_05385 [Candidatus Woesearchaeota archaeon]|nr:hypothetical protein [Candidatus Woesearchaeota archaeon]